jgi:hypothetical protein
MWRKLASYLEGTNREQTYDTWIGVGGNGKTILATWYDDVSIEPLEAKN